MAVAEIPKGQTISSTPSSLTIPVDAEHGGIRLAGCGSFIAAMVVTFLIVAVVMNVGGGIAVLTSIVVAGAVSYVAEHILRQHWPSGRTLHMSHDEIALRKRDKTERSIDPQTHVNVLAWHFVVKRTSRVKKGWYVVSLALEQDGEHVPIYAFASPDAFNESPLSHLFTLLERPKKNQDKSKAAVSIRKAGEQRRLLLAEQDRGYFGAEVTFEQFVELLDYLQKSYPQWMTS